MGRRRLLRLGGIATTAGAFSGLFGVGGGVVIVPLLLFSLAYREREAAGTSLVAIAVIGTIATIAQGLYGNVDLLEGALVGVPAVGGAVFGAELQQRVPERAISLIFAALLAAVAISFLIGG